MPYTIYEKTNKELIPVKNNCGCIVIFKSKRNANSERIYLQPDYNNLLIVKKVKV